MILQTDRLALREMEWNPDDPEISLNALVPARTLHDTAKALGPLGGHVTMALSQGGAGEGMSPADRLSRLSSAHVRHRHRGLAPHRNPACSSRAS